MTSASGGRNERGEEKNTGFYGIGIGDVVMVLFFSSPLENGF